MFNRFRLLFVFYLTLFFSPFVHAQINGEPDCSEAVADPAGLWPPNHKFEVINVAGVTDPDGDELEIVIDCIMQDEPLNTTGDGNTIPDGLGLGESQAEVRTERRGNSNGRFYHIGFTATDPAGASCSSAVTVTVAHDQVSEPIDEGPLYQSTGEPGEDCSAVLGNHPPKIVSDPVTPTLAGELYLYEVRATDEDEDALTFSLTEAPAGMFIESVLGVIQWPQEFVQVGEYPVTVEVDDGNGGTDTQTYLLMVVDAPVNSPPIITSDPVTEAAVDELYQYPVEAFDPDGDELTYSLLIAPDGMDIIAETGEISWIPNADQADEFSVTVQVDDGNGGQAIQEFTVRVNSPPEIISDPVITAAVDELYQYPVEAIDANDDDILTYELAEGAPATMNIDAQTGVIEWTPGIDDIGSVDVTVRVTDLAGAFDEQSYTITVELIEPPL